MGWWKTGSGKQASTSTNMVVPVLFLSLDIGEIALLSLPPRQTSQQANDVWKSPILKDGTKRTANLDCMPNNIRHMPYSIQSAVQ